MLKERWDSHGENHHKTHCFWRDCLSLVHNITRKNAGGVLYALAAFGFWGLVPVIYFKSVKDVEPIELLAHRVVWGLPLLALLVSLSSGWRTIQHSISENRVLIALCLSAGLIATNWVLMIYAVIAGLVLQASMGFFIIPMVNVAIGKTLLKETLRPWQYLALALAVSGTLLNLASNSSAITWIPFILAFTGSLYGYIRKVIHIESLNGLLIETSLLFPLAATYLSFEVSRRDSAFLYGAARTTLLLPFAGAITCLPLIWFTSAARRLNYTTIGFFQYLSPSLQFILAVFFFDEPLGGYEIVTFALIWAGLIVFLIESIACQKSSSILRCSWPSGCGS